jgi:hypothetical protein
MPRLRGRFLLAALAMASLMLAACGKQAETPNAAAVRVGKMPGTQLMRVVLSPEANARLGVRTVPVRLAHGASGAAGATGATGATGAAGKPMVVIPYAAVLYDPNGAPSTYTSPLARVYVRTPIVVDHLKGDVAYLKTGPPVGARVVSVGSAELLGAETGVKDQ